MCPGCRSAAGRASACSPPATSCVLPGDAVRPDQIVSSNTFALAALVTAWGGEPVDLGIAPDDGEALAKLIGRRSGADLLVTTGGASVGDYDLVAACWATRGMELDFWKIAMRPGKPLMFGRLGDVPVLGLPGNPVSTEVCAVLFLRPALLRMQGLDPARAPSDRASGSPGQAKRSA